LAQDPHNTDFTKGNANAWVDACDPNYEDGAITGPAFAKVGVDCQGFAQKKSHQSLAQDPHNTDFTKGDANAWVDACDESYKEGVWTAGGAVGVDCQGFAQKKSQSLAQDPHNTDFTKGDKNAWVDACDASYKEGVWTAGGAVGVDCQGFAQKKSKHSLAQVQDPHNTDFTKGDANAWVDACDESYKEGVWTAGGAVGVDCQGFA